MNNAIRQERQLVFARFGLLINQISGYHYGVPKDVVTRLLDFGLPLTAAKSDEVLRDMAVLCLEVRDVMLDYCKALNGGDRPLARAKLAEAVRLWQRNEEIIAEIERVS